MQREACGTALGLSAWVRFSVRRCDLSVGSWVRALVGSACRAAQFYGGKVTQARDLTSTFDDDRAKCGGGFTVLRAAPPAPAQFAAEAVLTAYTLMAYGRGRGRRLQRHHARNGNPMEPLVAGPATVGQPAKPPSPPSGEAVRAGLQDRALPPHSSLPNGPACDRRPPVVKTRGGLKKTGRRPLRHKPVDTDNKAPAHGARTA
jgi:hypothetical protein